MELPAEFHPELFSRRGEITAWSLAILAFISWWALAQGSQPVHWFFIFISLFFLIGALASSLSNWVDRRTVLRLQPSGVSYENGLRRLHIPWNEIQRVQVLPTRMNKLVRIFGREGQYFSFRTFGEVTLQGVSRGRVGFAQGELILASIIEKSGLKPARRNQTGGDDYVRE